VPWWNWIGGPLGAAFVLSGTLLVPRLGTATFLAAVIAGQLTCSLAIDHFGLMNIQQHPLTVGRTIGAILIFGGVIAIKYF
jgi:transporter family-2 protein